MLCAASEQDIRSTPDGPCQKGPIVHGAALDHRARFCPKSASAITIVPELTAGHSSEVAARTYENDEKLSEIVSGAWMRRRKSRA